MQSQLLSAVVWVLRSHLIGSGHTAVSSGKFCSVCCLVAPVPSEGFLLPGLGEWKGPCFLLSADMKEGLSVPPPPRLAAGG